MLIEVLVSVISHRCRARFKCGDVLSEHDDGFVINEFHGRARVDINMLTVVGDRFIGSIHLLESFSAFA